MMRIIIVIAIIIVIIIANIIVVIIVIIIIIATMIMHPDLIDLRSCLFSWVALRICLYILADCERERGSVREKNERLFSSRVEAILYERVRWSVRR